MIAICLVYDRYLDHRIFGPTCADYIGCMKHGSVWTTPGSRWYEPSFLLIGATYYMHAYGSIYVMSGRTVDKVVVRNFNYLRMFANEGIFQLESCLHYEMA